MSEPQEETVTLVVRHQVLLRHAPDYEVWLKRIVSVASRCLGHLGVNVVRSLLTSLAKLTCLLHFARLEQSQQWLESGERHQFVTEVAPMSHASERFKATKNHTFWFRTQSGRAPRWKEANVACLVVMPLSLLVPWLWQLLTHQFIWLGGYVPSIVVITLSTVLLLLYLSMLLSRRLFAGWLSLSAGSETNCPNMRGMPCQRRCSRSST